MTTINNRLTEHTAVALDSLIIWIHIGTYHQIQLKTWGWISQK